MRNKLDKNRELLGPDSNQDELYGPYTSVKAALVGVPIGKRKLGRTVGVITNGEIKEYWFQDGIINSDLEEKTSGQQEFTETDTLESVVQRGNGTTKDIIFEPEQGSYGKLGFNSATYSYYFGNTNPSSTGTFNVSMGCNALAAITTGEGNVALGFNSLPVVTTGFQNTSLGTSSGYKTTTGTYNTMVGSSALFNLTTGYKNVGIGFSAGVNASTGNSNIFVGHGAGNGITTGSQNIAIGIYSGQGNNGNNNVFIGVAAGANAGTLNNKLIIHSNTTLTGTGRLHTETGSFTNSQSSIANALVVGDFDEKWFRLNGNLVVNPTKLGTGAEFTKNIIAKPDGTFGWEDKTEMIGGTWIFSQNP